MSAARTSPRAAWALVILPAALVVLVYAYAVRGGVRREIDDLARRVEDARRDSGAAAREAQLTAVVDELSARVGELRERVTSAERLDAELRARRHGADPLGRAAVGDEIARSLGRHGLALVEESAVDPGEERITDDVLRRLGRDPSVRFARVMRVQGRFLDVLALLQEWRTTRLDAVPVGVRMRRLSVEEEVPTWTLVVL